MKTQLLCVLGLLFSIHHSFGQTDQQWLVKNGIGKTGFTTAGGNSYSTTVTVDNKFYLMGITPPNPGIADAANDLLVIYANGEHWNTRTASGHGDFYTAGASPNTLNHNFNRPPGSPVLYLYLTNRYETDDPPSSVKAIPGVMAVTNAPHTYTLGTSPSPIITANHTVVPGKDITLIINYDSLEIAEPQQGEIVVSFDGIQPAGGGGTLTTGLNLFNLKPVFASNPIDRRQAVFPNPIQDPGTAESIVLQTGNEQYRYVNLSPNSYIDYYIPSGKDTQQMEAVFIVTKGGVEIARHPEPIGLSHDPNYLQVESICEVGDGSHIVSYHLQFQNDGTGPENNALAASVRFPAHFDLTCFDVLDWYASGAGCSGQFQIIGDSCHFKFSNHGALLSMLTNRASSYGFVKFKVKVKPGYDVQDLNNSLMLTNPTVYFGITPYPLNEFRDLKECEKVPAAKGDGQDDAQEDNPNDPDKEEGDKDKKQREPRKGEEGEDPNKIVDPGQITGWTLNCYRPVSTGECNCEGLRPFPWKYIIGVLALLGLAILLFKLMAKKKNNPTT